MYFKYILLLAYTVYCRPDLNAIYKNKGTPPESAELEYESITGNGDVSTAVVSVLYNKAGKLEIHKGLVTPYVATGGFKDKANSTGWAYLKVTTNGSYPDLVQAEAAGMAEGYVTADFISMSYQNTMGTYCDNEKEFCDKLDKFLNDNMVWVNTQIKTYPKSNYWYQVSLIYKQVQGMFQGYVMSKMKPDLTLLKFRYIQIMGDLEDLEIVLGRKNKNKVVGSGSCSAIVKLFPKNADLAISHVTWGDYNFMLRVYKLYNFSFHNIDDGKVINGAVQSFSSYPGFIYSGDDFYILGSGMVTQETTIGNANSALNKYIKPSTVLEWARVTVANRLANSGIEWCSIFERYNSGTYNNQWMILDYKLFKAGEAIVPDTLWILEQLPGTVHMADMTILLEEHGYWGSYNIPYFPYVYNISGVTAMKKKYGSWFDYDKGPRAQIFHRDHKKVVDMQTLVKLMRYNDYKNDPVCKCPKCSPPYSGENAISGRSDLNPKNGTYPFGALSHRRHGGTDVKATNSQMAKKLSQFIAGGPTFDQQPPFQWSKTEWKKPLGHPDKFQFAPVLVDWSRDEWVIIP